MASHAPTDDSGTPAAPENQVGNRDEIRMTQCSVISRSTEVVRVNERGMHHSEMKGRGNVGLCKNEVMKSCGITPGTVIVCHYTW